MILKLLTTALLSISLLSCADSPGRNSFKTVESNRSYTLSIDAKMPAYYVDAIKKTVANSIPGEIDRLLIVEGSCGGSACASGDNVVVIKMPTNLSLGTFVATLGHELGHFDTDIKALPTKEREIACDMWGLMAAMDLGYDPYERINQVRNRNIPETDTHPSDAERARRMLEVVRNYKK